MSSPEPTFSGPDPFRHTLKRYIAEAPSGFVALGATTDGPWTPSIKFPGAISCRGGGPADGPFIESVLFTSTEREATEAQFREIVAHVETILPEWKKSDLSQFDTLRLFYANGPTMSETTASVDIATIQLGDDYNVNLVVQTWNLAS
jgi:hypothetical protein